MTPKHL